MARRREPAEPLTPGARPFTGEEVSEIRHLLAEWSSVSGHPHPFTGLLERIHSAAGRPRRFKAWELDPIRTPLDLERAVDEEVFEKPRPVTGDQHPTPVPRTGQPKGSNR